MTLNHLKALIQDSEYIYSAKTKFSLKKYPCEISYFETEDFDDLSYVICSIINTNDNGTYDKRSLGLLLGFAVADMHDNESPEVYYDKAEVELFDELLKSVANEHLIKEIEGSVVLTQLGKISLKEGKKFYFYKARIDFYEFLKMYSENQDDLDFFPFRRDLGITSQIQEKEQYWPKDDEVEYCIYRHKNRLIKRLELQLHTPVYIYKATQGEYFDIDVREVPVSLYTNSGGYFPAVNNLDNIAPAATILVNNGKNTAKRDAIIQECLFKKLWDDRNAVLDYNALKPFIEIVDFDELAKDSRTVWQDQRLFDLIVCNANVSCWKGLTRCCDLEQICRNIDSIKEHLDWPVFTHRVDDDFLVATFQTYPWDLEVLSADYSRPEAVLEQLILQNKDTQESWNWDELGRRLSRDFILGHLDLVDVNLSDITEDTEQMRKAIEQFPSKRWDYGLIESQFSLDFILKNIKSFGPYLGYERLLDRVFTDKNTYPRYIANQDFIKAIKDACHDDGPLSTSVVNEKDYIWTPDVIDFFTSVGLLSWQSTPYMKGFENNPSIIWDEPFFNRFVHNVSSVLGREIVSSRIDNIRIILHNPDFDWDWKAISSNKRLTSDIELYLRFGHNLDWEVVFSEVEDIAILESIPNIKDYIGENKAAWTAFSSIASIGYVTGRFKSDRFPWDWTILTQRLFRSLNLGNLGHSLFVDHWDWAYLSENLDIEFIENNLDKYKAHWEWSVVIKRLLQKHQKFDSDFMDSIAVIMTNISGVQKCEKAWTAFTSIFTFKELRRLIKETTHKKSYWWDINYFCQLPEFDIFRDTIEFKSMIDWEFFSSSAVIDEKLRFNPDLGVKRAAWVSDVKNLFQVTERYWDFKAISKFKSIQSQRWFLEKYKAKLDWVELTKESGIFKERDKQRLNEIIEHFKEVLDFRLLSHRTDVDIRQIMVICSDADYDYNELFKRNAIEVDPRFIYAHSEYEWDWYELTSNSEFEPTAKFLLSNINENINWNAVSLLDNEKLWSFEPLINKIAANREISSLINWRALSKRPYFPATVEILELLPSEALDWSFISKNESFPVGDSNILAQFKEYLNWPILCSRSDFHFTEIILSEFTEYIDWDMASSSQNIKFSKELVDKYQDRWNWPVLVKNRAFHNRINIAELPYGKQLNIIDFIKLFGYQRPLAYHFTHMSNAIKILKSMKLQSRNFADGNFSNSAGSNVHRTNKAHRFARFYFTTHTPTQYYNEFLGKDRTMRGYNGALGLGLPKCPLPVFFVFDIEEILMTMPEKCYYSNGNMQKDSSRYFKIIEDPTQLKAKEIFRDKFQYKDERQQEFLVDGELDFSKLHKVRVYCSDERQADYLRKELAGTRWENVIEVKASLYEMQNKQLHFVDNDEQLTISTDYGEPYEFRISYTGDNVPVIHNLQSILRQRGHDIFVQNHLEIDTTTPFEVYFEVKQPRIGSFLIYRSVGSGE